MKNVRKLLLIVTLCSLFIDVRAEGLSELLNDGVITLERSGTKVTMDMQNHKRVNYASKGKRPWLSLAVENNDRQGRNYWANFSHQAVIGVVPKKMSPEEHAEADKKCMLKVTTQRRLQIGRMVGNFWSTKKNIKANWWRGEFFFG